MDKDCAHIFMPVGNWEGTDKGRTRIGGIVARCTKCSHREQFTSEEWNEVANKTNRIYYPYTAELIRRAILDKFPAAEPNEYRQEWRDSFQEFHRDPDMIASRLLWMLDHMKTDGFQHNGGRPGNWIMWICGQMEGLGLIEPGIFISALHSDHSAGDDD